MSAISNLRNYSSNKWLTFFEVQEYKAKIKKGSKSTEVIFYKSTLFDKDNKPLKDADFAQMENKAGIQKRRLLKYYHVFNIDQIEGLPEHFYKADDKQELNIWEQNEQAEQVIKNTGAKIEFRLQNMAYYTPSNDKIVLPIKEQFTGATPFYSVCFHELIHWTGNEKRLNRVLQIQDKKLYAFEELIAELGSAFLCAQLGFEQTITDNTIYIKSWLTALKNDTSFIFKASAQANKAAYYILNPEKSALRAA